MRFSQEEFARRQKVTIQGLALFVATAEDIVISKLEWSRLGKSQRQLEDAAAILRLRFDTLDQPYLQKWISELKLDQEWSAVKRLARVSEV